MLVFIEEFEITERKKKITTKTLLRERQKNELLFFFYFGKNEEKKKNTLFYIRQFHIIHGAFVFIVVMYVIFVQFVVS